MSLSLRTVRKLTYERASRFNPGRDAVEAQWVHRRVWEGFMNKRRLATWRGRWLSYMAGR